MGMRVIAVALSVAAASILFELPAFAEPTDLPTIVIKVRPARPLVTELVAPKASLLAADPPPSFTPSVASAVSKSAF
jgi:hypothetical protein